MRGKGAGMRAAKHYIDAGGGERSPRAAESDRTMMLRSWGGMALAVLLAFSPLRAAPGPETRPSKDSVEGVWRLEKIVRSSGSVETQGGFIFQGGYYSTTVNYSQEGTQTNISQFGTYAAEGGRLSLVPSVQVSTRGQVIIYEPEPPFTLEFSIIGDEMKGVAVKDGTTFVFRRLH
jgi:hypothetical protein